MDKPEIIKHYAEIQITYDQPYPDSQEVMGMGSPFGQALGLRRLGIHHEIISPGQRSSYPHAHESCEEFVFVIAGSPDVWLDGHLHRLQPGEGIAFLPGTGIGHTFLNHTVQPVRLLVIGETQADRVHYPLHPQRNQQLGERWWREAPSRPLGSHDGLPHHPCS